MNYSYGLIAAFLGIIWGILISEFSLSYQEDGMCSGVPVVVKTADTIRTFSCTVELKAKENK